MADSGAQLNEQWLVLRCLAGDDRAFAALVRAHHAPLTYYVRRMVHDAARAEDVVQNVWVTVHRRLAGLRDPAAFRPWLYSIARNAVRAAERGRRTEPRLDEDALSGEPDVDEALVRSEDAARLHAAIGRLDIVHREVVVLRFAADMSYEQIADVLGCPIGTVRSRLHYALPALRRALETSP